MRHESGIALVALAVAKLARQLAIQLLEAGVASEQLHKPRVLALVGGGSSRASRSRIASEFAATRIWKPSRGSALSSTGVTSSRSRSAMADRSSARCGAILRHHAFSFRSCSRSTSVSTARRPIEASSIDFTAPDRCRHAC